MTTHWKDIQAALDNWLDTGTASIDIAWENAGYTPSVGTEYLRPTLIPAKTRQATLGSGGRNEVSGTYVVGCFYPAGDGSADALTMADAICSRFRRGTVISANGLAVRIDRVVRLKAVQEPRWFQVPVAIGWLAYVDN